jgi:hypothetical protein
MTLTLLIFPLPRLLFSSCAEITLIKGKIEEIELPVKEVDIIVSEVSPNCTCHPTIHQQPQTNSRL